MEEEQVEQMTSMTRKKIPCANISISKHAGQEESLTQMAVSLNAFMTTALNKPKDNQ